ncbi:MAG: 2-keto-4-pentenoate hydratase [Alphaproteobacteria bacterium]
MERDRAVRAAELLRDARTGMRRLDSLPEDVRPKTIDDGYRIQDELVALLGARVAGWKLGSTSKQAQAIVGTTEPFGARLLAPNVLDSPATLSARSLFMRAVESEFAFKLAEDLPPGRAPYGRDDVVARVASLHPAIEVSDSRYTDWSKVGAPSLIADNGNDGKFVLGAGITHWRPIDLARHTVALAVNGRTVSQGTGAAVLGDPVLALVWLANDRARRGGGLEAGQVITTGSCTGVYLAQAGDHVRADFGGMGVVDLNFES